MRWQRDIVLLKLYVSFVREREVTGTKWNVLKCGENGIFGLKLYTQSAYRILAQNNRVDHRMGLVTAKHNLF